MPVTSMALEKWRGARAERLDELLDAHARVGGTGPGRRYRTQQLNLSLILRLAGEFQGFARDLHDEAIDEAHACMSTWNPEWADASRRQLRQGRGLDRHNATPSTLGADFARLGLGLWSALRRHDARDAQRQNHLEHLNRARNAIAHDDSAVLQQLTSEGISLALATFRQWRAAADHIATGTDAVVAQHLATTFTTQLPW
jgi:hypothetical protein